ncbi:MAG TPA: MFS transporter [Thermomicrobiales bacterium]|nr:MFS transporter [Thermomicrobiales bacterium]
MANSLAAPSPAPARRAVIGWILYDLANVVYSINIGSLYFSLWVVNDAGGSDGHFGVASSTSMALVFIAAPFLGALSDLAPRRIPFLAVTTILCCALTMLLGMGGLYPSLVIFAIAYAIFQAGLIFYDSLLPTVSTEENRGWISGLGIGAGFAGALLGILTGLVVLSQNEDAKPLVFKLTALIFLVGSLPCFLWVRERPVSAGSRLNFAAMKQAVHALQGTVGEARQYPGLPRFLIGRVFYTDAGNTMLAFMGVYATKEVGFSEFQTQLVLLAGIITGPLGALVGGRSVDLIGPRRTLLRVLILWIVVLAMIAIVPGLNLPTWLFWIVAPLAGIAIGGTSATDRTLLLRLAPPSQIGRFFGLYAMVGRFAAIIGPLIWTVIVDWFGWGRPIAVAGLVLMVVIARAIVEPIDDSSDAVMSTHATLT